MSNIFRSSLYIRYNLNVINIHRWISKTFNRTSRKRSTTHKMQTWTW